jgi:hypothetical protein
MLHMRASDVLASESTRDALGGARDAPGVARDVLWEAYDALDSESMEVQDRPHALAPKITESMKDIPGEPGYGGARPATRTMHHGTSAAPDVDARPVG